MYVNIMFKFIKFNIHIQIVAAGVVSCVYTRCGILCVQQVCFLYPAGVLGDFCQVKDDCLVADSYCKSGICMCKEQYEASSNNKGLQR